MIKQLRPDEVWQPKLGAPHGNRNARKHGRRDGLARALASRIAKLQRSAKALISAARAQAKKRRHDHQ